MPDASAPRPSSRLAVVTGASSGIGRAIADELAARGRDLVVAAEDDAIAAAAQQLARHGTTVAARRIDLATTDGVEQLAGDVVRRAVPPEVLVLNAGRAVGGRFLETDLEAHLRLLALNVTGLVHLARRVLPTMAAAGRGRVLVTSSLHDALPGPYASTYAASSAFASSFAHALGVELAELGVTVTLLRAGPTATALFARAGMRDTRVGQAPKDDPGRVARAACDALLAGRAEVAPVSIGDRVAATVAGALPARPRAKLRAATTRPRASGVHELG